MYLIGYRTDTAAPAIQFHPVNGIPNGAKTARFIAYADA